MINLISYEKRTEIRAGRLNIRIRRYILLVALAMLLLIAIVGVGYVTLNTLRTSAQIRLNQSAQDIAEYSAIEARSDEFQANLRTAQSIFDSEVAYSRAYTRIANTLPNGVVINELALSSTSAGQPLEITAQARTEQIARGLKNTLQSHPDVFTDVFFASIANAPESDSANENNPYPYTVTLTATLSSEIYK